MDHEPPASDPESSEPDPWGSSGSPRPLDHERPKRERTQATTGRSPRTGWKVAGTIVVVLGFGYLFLLGFALNSLNCDGGLLGLSQCSDAQRVGYVALSLGGLLGIPLGLWLIWRDRRP